MLRSWSLGRIVAAGLFVTAVLTLLCSGVSIFALRAVAADKDRVITFNGSRRLAVESMRTLRERRGKLVQRYLITPEDRYWRQAHDGQTDFNKQVTAFRARGLTSEEQRLLDAIEDNNEKLDTALEGIMEARKTGASIEKVSEMLGVQRSTRINDLDEALNQLADHESTWLTEAQRAASERSSTAVTVVAGIAVLASLVAAAFALALGGFVRTKVGGVIKDVQGSSAELQSAANQQVESAERLTVVTAEITTTIQELLATSRQIAESAQRVTMAAEEATAGAGAGDETVQQTQDAIVGIKRQVDLIVSHMLDLDRKFQEVGAILDLIREFAEQTNILSINATIEAAGAGAAGKRFAVVADEIQRLADRVGGSTREIYQLIDEIRGAASATMLATEDGKRAVDNGAQKFNEVLSTFKQIATRSSVTTEAAREIELSTKQQTSAVEQVSLAIAGVGRAALETQESSSRTFTTSQQLAGISRKLTQLIRAE